MKSTYWKIQLINEHPFSKYPQVSQCKDMTFFSKNMWLNKNDMINISHDSFNQEDLSWIPHSSSYGEVLQSFEIKWYYKSVVITTHEISL